MPLLGPAMQDRNALFQRLKPTCVELSQAALALSGPKGDGSKITKYLGDVKTILESGFSGCLDEKLADYVFFPLSQVLKSSPRLSIRCLELCLECVAILAAKGWQQRIEGQLAAQLVILCTLLADRHPKNFSFPENTDELQVAAFTSLRYVFAAASASRTTKNLLTTESNFPQLGQTITNILDGIDGGRSPAVQSAATEALDSLIRHLADRELCAKFLPGIASRLVKVLTPSAKQRRNPRMLVINLGVLETLIKETLSDQPATNPRQRSGPGHPSIIDSQWLEQAATQLKPALASIARLRNNSRDDLQEGLCSLCLTVLHFCRKNLSDCARLALETVIAVRADASDSARSFSLQVDIGSNPDLLALLQDIIYGWLQNLPTVMQSADEDAKLEKIRQITSAYAILTRSSEVHSTLDKAVLTGLRDAVTTALQGQASTSHHNDTQIQSLDLIIPHASDRLSTFETALVENSNQRAILDSIERLANLVDLTATQATSIVDLTRSLRTSHGEAQIATFWLLLTMAKNQLSKGDPYHNFLSTDDTTGSNNNEQLEDLYSFAISILTDDGEHYNDPRLQMLALRALALRAQAAGEEFRYELVDSLYPVLHMLATPNEVLQRDSITSLNIIAEACAYASVRTLIVENVDYLTNAIALKLNTFDVSPQAPQVLLMMVRLAGPSLLPYLEDTVESIFAALEDYHGYPMLVELLFKVLRVMAEEGVKAPALAITSSQPPDVTDLLTDVWCPTSVSALTVLLQERSVDNHGVSEDLEPHPKRPWKIDSNDNANPTGNEEIETGDDASDEEAEQVSGVAKGPPLPKTYSLILKITELTQHFLPTASLSTTRTLLGLIKITAPALGQHDDSFLPLINTLWPEITARLDDEETTIRSQALDVISTLCEHAGDFMRSRIVQLWPRLLEIHDSVVQEVIASVRTQRDTRSKPKTRDPHAIAVRDPSFLQAVARMQASPADYSNTAARELWNALTRTLTTVADKLHLPPDLFDEALAMLTPALDAIEIRTVLEKQNADAVWLARVKAGTLAMPEPPSSSDRKWTFATLGVK